ncbi:hypothetical protein [Singulisphaera sp. PoT]
MTRVFSLELMASLRRSVSGSRCPMTRIGLGFRPMTLDFGD